MSNTAELIMRNEIELLTSEDGLRKIADEIIESNNITSITSREKIEECVKDYMSGQDDYLYYNEDFNNSDIRNRIADNIAQQASFVKPLIKDKEKTSKLFEQMVDDFCLEDRYNVSPELIQTIRTLIDMMDSNESNVKEEDTLTYENVRKWIKYAEDLTVFVYDSVFDSLNFTKERPTRPDYIKYRGKSYAPLKMIDNCDDTYIVFLNEVDTEASKVTNNIISVKIEKYEK